MSLSFSVPLPGRVLSPNAPDRHSWKAVGPARRDYRRFVQLAALDAAMKASWACPERAIVSLVAHLGPHPVKGERDDAYRPRDHGNLVNAFKPGFDGLVDAMVIYDDDAKHMILGSVALDAESPPCIQITIEELPP